jgi:hypothetical protein
MLQKRHQAGKRRQLNIDVRRHTHSCAGRAIKHPRRNLKTTVRICAVQAAAKNNAVCLVDRLVDTDTKTKPGMPSVQEFAKLGPVGVLKPCCSTPNDLTRGWTG